MIEDTIDKHILLLEERKKSLLNQLQTIQTNKEKTLDMQTQSISSTLSKAETSCKTAEKVNRDIFSFITLSPRFGIPIDSSLLLVLLFILSFPLVDSFWFWYGFVG